MRRERLDDTADATAHANDPLKMRIEGMDCGACAIKIEGALKRIPGIADIQVSYATGTLSLRLDEGRTSLERIEATIRGLGYASAPFDATALTTSDWRADSESGRRWWRLRKGRAAVASGTLLVAAFVVSTTLPQFAHMAFTAAAIVGLLPVANRAMAGIDSGAPFAIETLMTLATVGAISLGASRRGGRRHLSVHRRRIPPKALRPRDREPASRP